MVFFQYDHDCISAVECRLSHTSVKRDVIAAREPKNIHFFFFFFFKTTNTLFGEALD